MKDIIYPENHGKWWTVEDENKILDELKNNKSVDDISKLLNRTTNSIEDRIEHIALKLYFDGKSLDDILILTKLEEIKLSKLIEKSKFEHENYNENLHNNVNLISENISNINKKINTNHNLLNILKNKIDLRLEISNEKINYFKNLDNNIKKLNYSILKYQIINIFLSCCIISSFYYFLK